MKKTNLTIAAFAAATMSFALTSCDVEKTEEGKMPEVNVEGGNLPKYDVDAPDIDVDVDFKKAGEGEADANADASADDE